MLILGSESLDGTAVKASLVLWYFCSKNQQGNLVDQALPATHPAWALHLCVYSPAGVSSSKHSTWDSEVGASFDAHACE